MKASPGQEGSFFFFVCLFFIQGTRGLQIISVEGKKIQATLQEGQLTVQEYLYQWHETWRIHHLRSWVLDLHPRNLIWSAHQNWDAFHYGTKLKEIQVRWPYINLSQLGWNRQFWPANILAGDHYMEALRVNILCRNGVRRKGEIISLHKCLSCRVA